MFLIGKPDERFIRRFLREQKDAPYSYAEVGASRTLAPNGYNVDQSRIFLGEGRPTFERAIEALKNWKMFEMSWIKLCWPDTPIEVGAVVGVLAHHFGFWSLNACRIVYVLDEKGEVEKCGFAYGTLPAHGERGEERFSVEYNRSDEKVWYDLYAFSKPKHVLAKAGYPISRSLQKRFASESKKAMLKAVNGGRI